MQMLVGMLKPSGQGQNAAFTYAIDGIAAYVMTRDTSLRNSVHSGLVKGLSTVTDKDNTAFLLGVLQQFADKEDFKCSGAISLTAICVPMPYVLWQSCPV